MSYYITPEQYEIAEGNGIKFHTLYQRVYIRGMKPEEACVKPVQTKRTGLWYKWGHLALHNNISRETFYGRIRDNNRKMSCYEAATKPVKRRVKNG